MGSASSQGRTRVLGQVSTGPPYPCIASTGKLLAEPLDGVEPFATDSAHGARESLMGERCEIGAAQSADERDLRASDRHDSSGVSGLVDPAVGIASADDPDIVGQAY